MAKEIVDLPMKFMVRFFLPEPTGEVQASPQTRATNVLRWRRDLEDAACVWRLSGPAIDVSYQRGAKVTITINKIPMRYGINYLKFCLNHHNSPI